MNVEDEIRQLRRHVESLAAGPEEDLARYALRWPPMPPGFYWRMRWLVGCILRCFEWMKLKKPDSWPVSLRHSPANSRARPYLIWAVGTDRATLRSACSGFVELGAHLPGFVPVLVTDVPDFAFFSRLGWLVEYVPELQGAGTSYAARKTRFIARLYSHAPVVSVAIGLQAREQADEIWRVIFSNSRGP
jgi:hypothetical protein